MAGDGMMDTSEITRLTKLYAMTDSPNAEEADVAMRKCKELLGAHGKTMRDIPAILETPARRGGELDRINDIIRDHQKKYAADLEAERKAGGVSGRNADGTYTFYNLDNVDDAAASAEVERRKQAAERHKQAPEQEALIDRYGSEEAITQPCEREILLRQALKQWTVACKPPHQRWTQTIDGRGPGYPLDRIPRRVVTAISKAYALPRTIESAHAEFIYWREREREITVATGANPLGDNLDLPAQIRQRILSELIETKLRARNPRDILLRLEFSKAHLDSSVTDEIEAAMVRDLEVLARVTVKPVKKGRPVAGQDAFEF